MTPAFCMFQAKTSPTCGSLFQIARRPEMSSGDSGRFLSRYPCVGLLRRARREFDRFCELSTQDPMGMCGSSEKYMKPKVYCEKILDV